MNYNQNKRLNQLDENILIIGVDVSKKFHVARAQDFRGVEFKKGIKFDNRDKDLLNLRNGRILYSLKIVKQK